MKRTKDLSKQLIAKFMKTAMIVTAAVVMLVCVTLQAEAARVKVTASSARVRKQASTTSDVVTSVSNGDSFTIQSEVTGTDGYVWYEISVNNNLGYIRSDLAQKVEGNSSTSSSSSNTEAVTQIQPISAKVTGGQVRVRPDASTNGSVVTTVARDAVVTVNGMAQGADNKTWYSVSFRSGSNEITGFIRSDFLELAGEVVPMVDVMPEVPVEDTPTEEEPEVIVEVKDYETYESNGKWYLVNNTESPAYQYGIEDIFNAAETNAKLYEGSLKTIKSQKVFIVILVLLLVAVGVGATLVIFKMKDMLDEAYYEEVEKEVASKRQNKQQNVMQTVGKENPQKKPTVNGQAKPAAKPQQANGQPKQMPKQQSAAQPKQTAQSQKPQASKPAAQQPGQPKATEKPQQAPKTIGKADSEWKSKNFASEEEDDDFEYDFLNWDGEEEL